MICEICYTQLDDVPHRVIKVEIGFREEKKGICEDCFAAYSKVHGMK